MKIRSVTLHNFRSVDNGTFYLYNYSLLVGANNAGKSNVIDALRVFYDQLKYDDKRDFPKFSTEDDEAWIDVEFRLTNEEYTSLKDEYQQPENRLKVRKWLKANERNKTGIYGYIGDEIAEEPFYGAKNVQQGKVGKPLYIPAVSRVADNTKMSGPSPLRELVNEVVKKLAVSSKSLTRLTEDFESFATEFRTEKTEDDLSITDIETAINNELYGWDVDFKIGISPPSEDDIVKNLVHPRAIDRSINAEMDLEDQGHGLQRHIIYTLIQLHSRITAKPSAPKKKDFCPELVLLLFEEPEAFLHPTQQAVLYDSLRLFSRQQGYQVLVTTHSPTFVTHNSDDMKSIVHLSRKCGRTDIGQVTTHQISELFVENRAIVELLRNSKHSISLEELDDDRQVIQYFMWLGPERCGLFFANQVLLVEGPTERIFLDYLTKSGEFESPSSGLFILDCMGKYNIHRYMNLLGKLKIPHAVLFDEDHDYEHHARINEFIREQANEFTMGCMSFCIDLEHFLGMHKPENATLKPEHLLITYVNDGVSYERIEALTTNLNRLLSDPGVILQGLRP